MIDSKDIKKLGELARIKLNKKEIEGFKKDIPEILDYFEKLKEVKTEGISELVHPLEPVNDFREDRIEEVIPEESKSLVGQAPDKKGDYIKVKKIFE